MEITLAWAQALVAEGARLNMRLDRLTQANAALAAARAWARAARAATALGPSGQPAQRLPFEQVCSWRRPRLSW